MVNPYSAGTLTLQEAPSFAWRTNGLAISRQRRGPNLSSAETKARRLTAALPCSAVDQSSAKKEPCSFCANLTRSSWCSRSIDSRVAVEQLPRRIQTTFGG